MCSQEALWSLQSFKFIDILKGTYHSFLNYIDADGLVLQPSYLGITRDNPLSNCGSIYSARLWRKRPKS